MILLHGAFVARKFLLWAETSNDAYKTEVVTPPATVRRGPAATASTAAEKLAGATVPPVVQPLPLGASATAVGAVLHALGGAAALGDCRVCEAQICVPLKNGQPTASSPLVEEALEMSAPRRAVAGGATTSGVDNGDFAQATHAAMLLETVQMPMARVIELLQVVEQYDFPVTGVFVGADLSFWAAAYKFGVSLVIRQRFLPTLRHCDKAYRARWEPLLTDDDAVTLAALVRAMPHSSRALTLAGKAPANGGPASAPDARSTLLGFLEGIVDTLVRGHADNMPTSAAAEHAAMRAAARATLGRPAYYSVHDAWMAALGVADDAVTGSAADLEQLAAHCEEWRRPIRRLHEAPWRLCLRLEEPAAGPESDAGTAEDDASAKWRLHYLLQARDDPSALVPATRAYIRSGAESALPAGHGFDAREYLLTALGQAAGICPAIEDSLRAAAPGGATLDTAAAERFLSGQAAALEAAGFGIQLPSWWTRHGSRMHLSARARVHSGRVAPPSGNGLSLDAIVHFDWEVALGDERLDIEELQALANIKAPLVPNLSDRNLELQALQALANIKAPLVRFRGQWVQLNAHEIGVALQYWKNRASHQTSVRDLVRMALGAGHGAGPLPLENIEAGGWIGEFLQQLKGNARYAECAVPAGFEGTLRPYQVRGYSWLNFLRGYGLGACLADDMGLGKTPTALAFLQREWEACKPRERRPALLVCPTSVIANWQKEAARFTPQLPLMVHHGLDRRRGAEFAALANKHALVVSSYALLPRDFEMFRSVKWAGIVLDEAQNIKNPDTKQSRAARALGADWRIALTGTPVENNVGDLWSLMEFLNAGFLGGHTDFRRRFLLPIQSGIDPKASQKLQALTTPFVLRRLKTDKAIIADLPAKMEMKVFCSLTKEQASLYAAVLKETERELEAATGMARRGLVLATLMRLKQVCNHPAQLLQDNSPIPGRSAKLARLTEMLEEVLSVGERALVFTQFQTMGAILQNHLQETFGRETLFLHGQVPKKARDAMVDRFQSETTPAAEAPPLFILSLKAGGVGLNLTQANHVFHFDRWWNPAVENQATDRAFRIGQTKNVQVNKFVCAGTFEERIDEMIERKKAVAEQVVGSGEGWLTELSTSELKQLFALRADAVSE